MGFTLSHCAEAPDVSDRVQCHELGVFDVETCQELLRECSVVEAVVEDLAVKHRVLAQAEKHVGEDTVGPGRAWDRQHSSVEESAGSRATHCLRGEVGGDARGRGNTASDRNGSKINEYQRHVATDMGGDIVPAEFLSEVDDLRGHADRWCASRHWTFP